MLIKTYVNGYWLYKCYKLYLVCKSDLNQWVQQLWDRLDHWDHRSRFAGELAQLQKGAMTLHGQERMGCRFETWQMSWDAFRSPYQVWTNGFQTICLLSALKKTKKNQVRILHPWSPHPVWEAFSLIPRFCKTVSRDSCQSCRTQNTPLAISSLPPATASAAPAVTEQRA